MKEFEFIKYLLAEVEEEVEKVVNEKIAWEKYRKADENSKDYKSIRQEYWDTPKGNKSIIKNNLRLIRRISLKIEKETEK